MRETICEGMNGFLVVPDERAFAAKIDEVLRSPAMLQSMSKRARDHVRAHWGMAEANQRLEKMLDRTASGCYRNTGRTCS